MFVLKWFVTRESGKVDVTVMKFFIVLPVSPFTTSLNIALGIFFECCASVEEVLNVIVLGIHLPSQVGKEYSSFMASNCGSFFRLWASASTERPANGL